MITFFSMSVTYLTWRNLDNYWLIIGLNSSVLVKFSVLSHPSPMLSKFSVHSSPAFQSSYKLHSILQEFGCAILIEPVSQTW